MLHFGIHLILLNAEKRVEQKELSINTDFHVFYLPLNFQDATFL